MACTVGICISKHALYAQRPNLHLKDKKDMMEFVLSNLHRGSHYMASTSAYCMAFLVTQQSVVLNVNNIKMV